jgi:hypothetical protein
MMRKSAGAVRIKQPLAGFRTEDNAPGAVPAACGLRNSSIHRSEIAQLVAKNEIKQLLAKLAIARLTHHYDFGAAIPKHV